MEETGISLSEAQLRFIGYFDAPNRDPRGRLISFAFEACVEVDTQFKAGDDAGEAQWFSLDDLPELAFDHLKIIEQCLAN